MDLVIDIGNTLRKVAVCSEEGELVQLFYEKQLTDVIFGGAVCGICFRTYDSVVGGHRRRRRAMAWLSARTRLVQVQSPMSFAHHDALCHPRDFGYRPNRQCGGSHTLYPNKHVLSIMAGTCLVTDFVNDKGRILGRKHLTGSANAIPGAVAIYSALALR